MNSNDAYVQPLASLQRIRDELAANLISTDDPVETELLRDQLVTVHSAVQRVNALAERYERVPSRELALADPGHHRPTTW